MTENTNFFNRLNEEQKQRVLEKVNEILENRNEPLTNEFEKEDLKESVARTLYKVLLD